MKSPLEAAAMWERKGRQRRFWIAECRNVTLYDANFHLQCFWDERYECLRMDGKVGGLEGRGATMITIRLVGAIIEM